jgi:hypothetical protein
LLWVLGIRLEWAVLPTVEAVFAEIQIIYFAMCAAFFLAVVLVQ